ncbi:DgyrCDS9183 [Dimorphilus gyrociliatus]|uniref:DgyrCDS9183 n=1 Tax=Dimorphilus gyrociliatus TaxID=2664684 RepID=A0A7I8VWM3_9ANNE|nr:DgyrCDS9183 [Dimorphilus gyrociliatus]
MLQRRKRYRNRTILGYKTLARGEVNLTQVLQKSQDRQLELYNANKESCRNSVGFIVVQNLTTLPVNEEQNGGASRAKERVFFSQNSEAERSPEGELSEDDLEDDSYEEDLTEDEDRLDRIPRVPRRRKMPTRFRHSDDALEIDPDEENQRELEELIDELDDELSDSPAEQDNISVVSTPKPKLKPFFASKTSKAEDFSDDSGKKNDSDGGHLIRFTHRLIRNPISQQY